MFNVTLKLFRTLIRYLNLSSVLALQSIAVPVKKRFPSLEHLIEGGYIQEYIIISQKLEFCFQAS